MLLKLTPILHSGTRGSLLMVFATFVKELEFSSLSTLELTQESQLSSDHRVETRICCRANEFSIACRQEIIRNGSAQRLSRNETSRHNSEQIIEHLTLLDLGDFPLAFAFHTKLFSSVLSYQLKPIRAQN